MSANTLRRRFLRDFRNLDRYSRLRGWTIVGLYVASIVLGIVVGHVLISLPVSMPSILGIIACSIWIGTRLRGLNNIVHECSHATFTDDREENFRIGRFCASLLLGSFFDYRREHLTHHAHLGDYEHDLDLQAIESFRLHEPLSPSVVLRHILTPLTGRHLKLYLRWNLSRADGLSFQLLKMFLLLSTVVAAAMIPLTTLFFILLPYALIYTALNYWADCIDHAGIASEKDDLDSSRNVSVPFFVKWLIFPRNDCFHLVHHLFPNVPAQHLEQAHLALSESEIYNKKQNANPEPPLLLGAIVTRISNLRRPARQ